MVRDDQREWIAIAASSAALSYESAAVISLRLAQAGSGSSKAAAEAWRMYSEKVVALLELQTLFLTGALGLTPEHAAKRTLRHYRGKVAANRRRLLR